jgi:hypothetical protein
VDKHCEHWSKKAGERQLLLNWYHDKLKLKLKLNDDDNSSNYYQLLSAEISQLNEEANRVQEAVENAKTNKNLSNDEIERVKGLIKDLEKRRKYLFDIHGPHTKFLKEVKKAEERRRKEEQKKLQEKCKKEEEVRKQSLLQEEKEREAENRAFPDRRAKQLKFANHPKAKNLTFSKLRVGKHAIERWHDRGRSLKHRYATIADFLQDLDDAKIFYRMHEDERPETGLRYVIEAYFLLKNETTEGETNDKEMITLIVDKDKTAVITVLRDDDNYDYTVERERNLIEKAAKQQRVLN